MKPDEIEDLVADLRPHSLPALVARNCYPTPDGQQHRTILRDQLAKRDAAWMAVVDRLAAALMGDL